MGMALQGRVNGLGALILRCQQFNRLLGTSLGPWELEQLPEEWLTALEVWVDELPKVKAWQAESAAALARVRNRKRVQ